MKRPVIYDYLDYRSFLGDLFHYQKFENSHFSYRYFSHKAGFSSPNFLKLVTNGQRNLTNSSIAKVAKGFGMKKQEREFFENMVYMNQAISHDEKNHYYRKMISLKGYTQIHTLEKAKYEYFSTWYFPIVREIIAFGTDKSSPEEIAGLLNPKITIREAENALKLLEKLELIKKNNSGKWTLCDRDITTGPEISSLTVANFHREMISLAAESMERHPANERDISALTLSIQRESLSEFKTRLIDFRRELMEMAGYDENPERVIQINIQMFPVTK